MEAGMAHQPTMDRGHLMGARLSRIKCTSRRCGHARVDGGEELAKLSPVLSPKLTDNLAALRI
jgi:hypothetical protein